MSLKIILTSVCFCSLAALCLQGVEPPCACATALGVHRAKCCSSAPSWPQCPCQPWSQLLSLLPLTITIQTWTTQLISCRSGRNAVIQREQWSVPAGEPKQKVYAAWVTAATGCQRPLDQRICWSFPYCGVGYFLLSLSSQIASLCIAGQHSVLRLDIAQQHTRGMGLSLNCWDSVLRQRDFWAVAIHSTSVVIHSLNFTSWPGMFLGEKWEFLMSVGVCLFWVVLLVFFSLRALE